MVGRNRELRERRFRRDETMTSLVLMNDSCYGSYGRITGSMERAPVLSCLIKDS